jgi:hypothetical protein
VPSDSEVLVATRKSLHAVAELVLAGPQYRSSGSIELRAAPGGFATVAAPWLAVRGDALLAGDQHVGTLPGSSCAELAAAAGVEPGGLEGVYTGGSGASPADPVILDAAAARLLADAFASGDAALRMLEPSAVPVLWPEHFDIAITVAEVNFGVSPGDAYLPEPYAYVGPLTARHGPFWNAPFGAARPLTELPDAEAIYRFFAEGRDLA